MKITNKYLLSSAACLALVMSAGQVMAETVTTKTVVAPKVIPDAEVVNFSSFDLNGDNILSMEEVGTKLFYVFDTDNNEVIDNKEFDHRQVVTVTPMEKETYTFTDWDSDGETDEATFEYETFFEQSGLMRFDQNMDGLSGEEFIQHTMLELDIDKSGVLEIDEWQKAYEISTRPANADNERYN